MTSTLIPQHLTCEYRSDPIGIGERVPRLSWKLQSDERGAVQKAYQILAKSAVNAGDPLIWDTGKVVSDESIHVPFGGPALASGQRVYWQVRVWDAADAASDWSAPAFFEMGLLDNSEWQAKWISPDWDEDTSDSKPAPMLRCDFALSGEVKSARLYITSKGLYDAQINGQPVTDSVLNPGWTAYEFRTQYQTYDVTALLNAGDNAIGVMLGDGWYRGWLGFEGNRNTWGDRLALLAQLHVTYADGSTAVITSDDQWHAATGPVLMNDLYNGEIYDARLEMPGWTAPGFDAQTWKGVRVLEEGTQHVVAQDGALVKCFEELRPIAMITTPAGETVLDMGQNMVGWVRVRAQGLAGTTITLQHAEVLDQQGNFYIENLRKAKQLAVYTLKGDGVEVLEPHFTFMGFRYVKVEGYPGELTLDSLTGVVVHSDMPSTGAFECSNPMINQLQRNIVWGLKGNFVDVPTDCPQRDERLGWTGDAQVFIRTAIFNRDVAAFFTKWLRDLNYDQKPDGAVPMVIPDPMGRAARRRPGGMGFGGASAAWADVATIAPWTLYQCYGDKRLLEEQYPSMTKWVGYMQTQAGETHLWTSGFHFGDWLDYRGTGDLMTAPPITENELIASAFYVYSTHLTCETAKALSKDDDAAHYAELLKKIKAAFIKEYVTDNGRVAGGSQTSYVLALHFDILPEGMRQKAADRLAESVIKFGYHLTTGFVGTPYLCFVLSRFGYTNLAYELLNQETFPSWLYPVKMGATTIWERWDGIKPDGTFQDVGMNSFNHYAYGAIGDWMYRVVCGLDTLEPGYKHVVIAPQPGGGLTHALAALDTPYGKTVSAWQLTDNDFRMQVTVPANAKATVHIPATALAQVTESGKPLASAKVEGNAVVVDVGSGTYEFMSTGMNMALAMQHVRHVAGRLDIGCTLGELLANERSKAVLAKHFDPQLFTGPMVRFVMGQPLDNIGRQMRHLITPEKLHDIQKELIAL